MTVSLCGSWAGLTGRLGVVGVVLAAGRVGATRTGVRVGVVLPGVRLTGRGGRASSSEGEGGLAGVRTTRAGSVVSGSRSAETGRRLRAAKRTAATITMVLADFITSPFISLYFNIDFLHISIGKKPPKSHEEN